MSHISPAYFTLIMADARKEKDMLEKEIQEENPEKNMRYGVYAVQGVLDTGQAITRSFIVIRNGYGLIVKFTRLEEYVGFYSYKTYKPIGADPGPKLYYITSMLNYLLVDHGAELGIRHIFQITKEMLEQFFYAYALETKADGRHKGQSSIEVCISTVTGFMANLSWKFGGFMKVDRSSLYQDKLIYDRKGHQKKIRVPDFQVVGVPEVVSIFRNIPTKAFEIMIPLAFRYARGIAFAMCLQAFAGLRPGETCNVRQANSPLGPGIVITEVAGRAAKIELDLTREMNLRSDGVKVGDIKKERKQCVYPVFINAFMKAYELHKEYLATRKAESEYCPMFVNARGMAMTYKNYKEAFDRFIEEHFRQELLKCEDPELRLYGQLLYENKLAPHALRHWFTVQLVLKGEDIGNLQFWRGDKSPQSSFTYLQNKGDLNKELENANDRLAELLMDIGEEAYEA